MDTLKATLLKSWSRLASILGNPSQKTLLCRLNHFRNTEEPDLYTTGGFHRVSLGDTFDHGRYAILRKLGYGQYSTVWLAQDFK